MSDYSYLSTLIASPVYADDDYILDANGSELLKIYDQYLYLDTYSIVETINDWLAHPVEIQSTDIDDYKYIEQINKIVDSSNQPIAKLLCKAKVTSKSIVNTTVDKGNLFAYLISMI